MTELPSGHHPDLVPPPGAYERVVVAGRRRRRRKLGALGGTGALALAAIVFGAGISLGGGTDPGGRETLQPATPTPVSTSASPAATATPSASASAVPVTPPGAAPSPAAPKAPAHDPTATAPATTPSSPDFGGSVEEIVSRQPLFGGTADCAPAVGSPVRIGYVGTLSGVYGELLRSGPEALRRFVRAQNDCNGLNGHRLSLTVMDDQGSEDLAERAARTLVQDGVLALVGDQQPLTLAASSRVANAAGIPVIGSDLLSRAGESSGLVFAQGSTQDAVVRLALRRLTSQFPGRKLAHLYCATDMGCREAYETGLLTGSEEGMRISFNMPAGVGSQRDDGEECRVLRDGRVEGVVLTLRSADAARFIAACRAEDYRPTFVLTPLAAQDADALVRDGALGGVDLLTSTSSGLAAGSAAETYFQTSIAQYGATSSGAAAGSAWTSGALLVAASGHLSAVEPTPAELVRGLREFRGQPASRLGGLSPIPLSFDAAATATPPDCAFLMTVGSAGTGYVRSADGPICA